MKHILLALSLLIASVQTECMFRLGKLALGKIGLAAGISTGALYAGMKKSSCEPVSTPVSKEYVKSMLLMGYEQTKDALSISSKEQANIAIEKIEAERLPIETCLRKASDRKKAESCVINIGKMFAAIEYQDGMEPVNAEQWDERTKGILKAIELDVMFKGPCKEYTYLTNPDWFDKEREETYKENYENQQKKSWRFLNSSNWWFGKKN